MTTRKSIIDPTNPETQAWLATDVLSSILETGSYHLPSKPSLMNLHEPEEMNSALSSLEAAITWTLEQIERSQARQDMLLNIIENMMINRQSSHTPNT